MNRELSPRSGPVSRPRWSQGASRVLALTAVSVFAATPAWPCSVCFGAGDPDAAGFAWGVLVLLLPVLLVQILLFRFLWRTARRERLGIGLSASVACDSVALEGCALKRAEGERDP